VPQLLRLGLESLGGELELHQSGVGGLEGDAEGVEVAVPFEEGDQKGVVPELVLTAFVEPMDVEGEDEVSSCQSSDRTLH